jgi:hypothetical protein
VNSTIGEGRLVYRQDIVEIRIYKLKESKSKFMSSQGWLVRNTMIEFLLSLSILISNVNHRMNGKSRRMVLESTVSDRGKQNDFSNRHGRMRGINILTWIFTMFDPDSKTTEFEREQSTNQFLSNQRIVFEIWMNSRDEQSIHNVSSIWISLETSSNVITDSSISYQNMFSSEFQLTLKFVQDRSNFENIRREESELI